MHGVRQAVIFNFGAMGSGKAGGKAGADHHLHSQGKITKRKTEPGCMVHLFDDPSGAIIDIFLDGFIVQYSKFSCDLPDHVLDVFIVGHPLQEAAGF